MNKFKNSGIIFLCVCILIMATHVSLEASSGTVTLPLDDFINLTRKPAPAKPDKPTTPVNSLPVKYIFTDGTYHVNAQSSNTRVEGTVTLIIYQAGWVEIPLVPRNMAISSASLDGKKLPLYVKDGTYHFLAKGQGEHILKLHLYVNTAKNGNTMKASFNLPRTTVSNLAIVVSGEKMQVNVNPAIITSMTGKKGKTIVKATVPSPESAIAIDWTPKKVIPKFAKPKVTVKPKLYSTVNTLLSVKEGALKATTRLNYSILYNEVNKLHFALPDKATVINISGSNFLKWEKSAKKGENIITVYLSKGTRGAYALNVDYEVPISKINSTWEMPVLQALGVERQTGTIGLYSEDNIEITMAGLQGAYQIDEKELPEDIRKQASTPILLAFKYSNPPYQISIESRKLEEVAVLTTTIDLAQALTVVNDEGTALTTITYQVRNNQKQYLELEMPGESRLLSSFVNNKPAKPVKGKDGKIMIPLLKSKDENEAFSVELTYLTAFGHFKGFNVKSTTAPLCNIPISQFAWSLYLPEDQKILKFAGDMKPGSISQVYVAPPADPFQPVSGAQDKLKTSRKVEVKPCADNESQACDRDMAFEKKNIAKIDTIVSSSSKGLNPIKMQIPQAGKIYRFKKLLVIDQQPQIIAYLYQGWIYSLLLFSFFGGAMTLGLVIVNKGVNKNHALVAAAGIIAAFILRSHLGEFFSYGLLALAISAAWWLWKNYSLQKITELARNIPWKKDIMPVK